MQEKDDSAWVFDSLIGFLQGPIWSSPLMTFIEENSLIFEPDTEDCKEYREIYQEYKNLVDLLLGCYMEDIGITSEQFELACAVNTNTRIPIQFQQVLIPKNLINLFEQIWAANEFEIFKRMMIQKNLELQLQALNMIEQKYGLTPASLTCGNDNFPDDEIVMEQILNRRDNKEETQENSVTEEEEEEEKEEKVPLKAERERLAQKYNNERARLAEALKNPDNSSSLKTSDFKKENLFLETLPESSIDDETKIPEEQQSSVSSKLDESSETKQIVERIRDEDIKKRQNYLKAQRDKLVILKKKARKERLEKNSTRPSSARVVAEAAMKGENDLDLPQSSEPSSILQLRKALAARLKAEVVNK
ncbi:cilia- and flagella-associated protein 36 isoform X2 [Leptopilina boulardi]|uniref:cilia- and flagella-associated protein 36 isoform X2 n=1 Tax=Leptopilina boulardi TaxID=63433 RepID=UPI0021F578D0|nr:cilia- and flagella-associated protein 36 isoform X2 [Leptopilina boulardi]